MYIAQLLAIFKSEPNLAEHINMRTEDDTWQAAYVTQSVPAVPPYGGTVSGLGIKFIYLLLNGIFVRLHITLGVM